PAPACESPSPPRLPSTRGPVDRRHRSCRHRRPHSGRSASGIRAATGGSRLDRRNRTRNRSQPDQDQHFLLGSASWFLVFPTQEVLDSLRRWGSKGESTMETAGALAAGSDRPFRNGWFERQTFWPSVAIVLLVRAVAVIPTCLNHAIAEPTSTVAEGDTATLKSDDDHQVVVEPIPGWERIDSPPDQLQLRNGKAS